jgi:hypothetical protein
MQVFLPSPANNVHLMQWPPKRSGTSSPSTNTNNSSSDVVPEQPQELCEPVLGKLGSKHSKYEAFVVFRNITPYTVRMLWMNYQGRPETGSDAALMSQAMSDARHVCPVGNLLYVCN